MKNTLPQHQKAPDFSRGMNGALGFWCGVSPVPFGTGQTPRRIVKKPPALVRLRSSFPRTIPSGVEGLAGGGSLIVISLVLVGMFAFAVGTRFQRKFAYFGGFYNRQFAPRIAWMPHGRGMMGSFRKGIVQGQITKIENNTVTVQLPDGGTYSISNVDQTMVNKTTKGTKEDLKVGQTITVFGGSFLNGAQTILINP